LHARLIIDMTSALQAVDQLGSKLENVLKPKSGGGTFGNEFKQSLAFIRAEAVKLGRDMDVVNAKFGVNSKESQALAASIRSTAGAFAQKNTALRALSDQYRNGEISMTQFRTGVINVQSAISNLNNKLSGATPIRAMQKDIQGLQGSMSNLVSTALPQFGRLFGVLGSIKNIMKDGFGGGQAVYSLAPDAVSSDYLQKLVANRAAVAAMGGEMIATAPAFSVFAGAAAAATGALVLLGTAIAGVATANAAIKTGAEFEQMEFQMTALINASTKFKDETTGNFVGMQKNLELSLQQSKSIIQKFVEDAPKLAGTNLKELTETASVTLGRLAGVGITDPQEQARLIESMTVAIKTVTAGQQNAGVQLAQESRALLAGEFKATNTLINQLATNVGGQDQFKKLFEEAKKAGKLGEFLETQLKPYLAAANFASASFSNLNEILNDFVTNTLKSISDNGVFDAAKEAFKGLLSPVIEFGDPSKFGSVKQNILDLAASIGQNLGVAIQSLAPLLPAITTLLLTLATGLNGVLAASQPLIEVFAFVATALINLTTTGLQFIGGVLQPLGDAFLILSQIILNEALIPIMDGFREFLMVGQSTSLETASSWQMLGDIMALFSQAALLMVSDYSAGMQMLQSVTAAAGSAIASIFNQMAASVLNSIADMVSKAGQMIASLAGPLGGIVSAMGGKLAGGIKGMAGKLSANAGNLKASALNSIAKAKSFKIPTKSKPLPVSGFKGVGAPQAPEKEKKGEKGKKPYDPMTDQERLDKSKAQLEIARQMAATDERINKIKETQSQLNSVLASQELGIEAKKDRLQKEERGLSLERKKLDLAFETGRITEVQRLEADKQIQIKKVEIDYQQQLATIELKRLDLQKEFVNVESDRLQKAEELKEGRSKLETINAQIAAAKNIEAGNTDKTKTLDLQQNVLELEKSAVDAKAAVDRLLSGNKQSENAGNDRVAKIRSEIESLTQTANDTKRQALEEVEIDFQLQKRNANTFGNIVRDAGKGFVTDIAQGMKAGDGFLGAVIAAGEKFISVISDNLINIGIDKLFKNGNPFAGLGGGDQVGGAMQGVAGAVGNAGKKGGGLLSKFAGLGALAGPMGALVGVGVAAVGAIGGGLLSKFKKKKADKREARKLREENMKWLEEFRAAEYVENIRRNLESYFKNLDKALSEFDRKISKLNVNGSTFDAQKAINTTQEKIGLMNKAIEQTVNNTNQQIAVFANEANNLNNQLLNKRGRWKQAEWDKWKRIIEIRERLIPEIQRASADQIDDLIQQQKDLNNEIEDFVEQQKQLTVDIRKEAEIARAGLAFGDDAEGLMSELITFKDKVREMLLSGMDIDSVTSILDNERRKLDQSMESKGAELRDSILDAQKDLADTILGINDEMLGVLDEGRGTGFLKATNQDKIDQLAEKLKAAREGSGTDLNKLKLDEVAFKAQADYFVNALDGGISKVFSDVKQGLSELSGITVTVNDPKFIASEVERIWQQKQKMPSFIGRVI